MNDKSIKIIRALLISAATSFVHHVSLATEAKDVTLPSLGKSDDGEEFLKKVANRSFKNVLTVRKNGDVDLLAAHTSHRSHSSHSSHSSHRSGSSSGHYSHSSHTSSSYRGTSSSSSYSSSSSSSYSSSSSVTTAPKKTIANYELGDRTLKSGLYGHDMEALIELLEDNLYIRKGSAKKQEGYWLFDNNIKKAVSQFQTDASLTVNGEVDSQTILKLRTWSKNKTTIDLGVRDLSLSEYGNDVDELVRMLTLAGYAPDPSKLTKNDGHYIFTADIKRAVEVFQAFNGLTVNGTTDTATVNKLKALAK